MTTLDVMSSKKKPQPSAEETAAKELVGLSLTGPDGLLNQHRIGSRYLDDPT